MGLLQLFDTLQGCHHVDFSILFPICVWCDFQIPIKPTCFTATRRSETERLHCREANLLGPPAVSCVCFGIVSAIVFPNPSEADDMTTQGNRIHETFWLLGPDCVQTIESPQQLNRWQPKMRWIGDRNLLRVVNCNKRTRYSWKRDIHWGRHKLRLMRVETKKL